MQCLENEFFHWLKTLLIVIVHYQYFVIHTSFLLFQHLAHLSFGIFCPETAAAFEELFQFTAFLP